MKYDDFYNKLIDKMNKIDIKLSDNQVKNFFEYMNFLLEWNDKINLTSITNEDEIILKHFVDCATICKYINDGKLVIDIGTGAGFPGIPIKIINKDLKIVLVDSLNKRINFLNNVVKKLNLSNIELIHSRVEDLAQDINYREKYDLIVSRAVAPLNVLSEYTLPFIKIGGKNICMKGNITQEEIENSKKAIDKLGGKVSDIVEFNLPDSDLRRSIVFIDKVNKTPKQYPRKAGKPSKDPII